jgi:hypothetical protein
MAEELKKLIKERTNTKSENVFIFIKVREAKDVTDLRIKEEGKGITELRIHTTDKKLPQWYTHAYLIDLQNINLKIKDIKNKKQLQDILLNPKSIGHQDTRKLLETLEKNFGGIIPDGSNILIWRTEEFKKKKDPFKVKRKAL